LSAWDAWIHPIQYNHAIFNLGALLRLISNIDPLLLGVKSAALDRPEEEPECDSDFDCSKRTFGGARA
jgi:hypothetical protein